MSETELRNFWIVKMPKNVLHPTHYKFHTIVDQLRDATQDI